MHLKTHSIFNSQNRPKTMWTVEVTSISPWVILAFSSVIDVGWLS
jgi:hypothetical protein